MARMREIPLFSRVLAQIACQTSGAHLGNAGLLDNGRQKFGQQSPLAHASSGAYEVSVSYLGNAAFCDFATGLSRSRQGQEAKESLAYLEQMAARFHIASVEVRTRVVVAAHVASAILDEAMTQSCDLIAIATHGRGGIKRLCLGSIADKVLRSVSRPLLICRSHSHDDDLPPTVSCETTQA